MFCIYGNFVMFQSCKKKVITAGNLLINYVQSIAHYQILCYFKKTVA